MSVGNNIKKQRKIKKMNQTKLAELLELSLRTIQKYESGEIVPSLKVIDQIAEALEISKWEIIEDDRSSKEIIESVKEMMDKTTWSEFNKIYQMSESEIIGRFRNILFNLNLVGINPYEPKSTVIKSVLFSNEFKDHTIYLLNKYSSDDDEESNKEMI